MVFILSLVENLEFNIKRPSLSNKVISKGVSGLRSSIVRSKLGSFTSTFFLMILLVFRSLKFKSSSSPIKLSKPSKDRFNLSK